MTGLKRIKCLEEEKEEKGKEEGTGEEARARRC